MPSRLSVAEISSIIEAHKQGSLPSPLPPFIRVEDVLIAGSGPIASAYARTIIDSGVPAKVLMVEIGSQDNPVVGAHHKNSIKYQKDIDAFVNVIKGALQPISVFPGDTYISTLGGNSWKPQPADVLIFEGSNPTQQREVNLKASAVTRTVGGMATHWTASCPTPHAEEKVHLATFIQEPELTKLFDRGQKLLNINSNEYDKSARHHFVKTTLVTALGEPRGVTGLPLAVERRKDNPAYVTWTGTNTVLGKTPENSNFELWAEARVTKLFPRGGNPNHIDAVLVRDLVKDMDVLVLAKAVVVACGAVGTPQVLVNSNIQPKALGRYLCEQSLAFCQIVLKPEIIAEIKAWADADFKERLAKHERKHPHDPLPIPFNEPEPQVMIPYSSDFPWHCQIHRDAFSYGDVGPRADSRVVVDLRFFGRQVANAENKVFFGPDLDLNDPAPRSWDAGVTDMYGMPQASFKVIRSPVDLVNDHKMMNDMTNVANHLGGYLPASEPQFMDPGLAMHVTGTTRIGTNKDTSVADLTSRVHDFENLWVGGNGCIPDSTGCNPTLTSVAIALKGADALVEYLKGLQK